MLTASFQQGQTKQRQPMAIVLGKPCTSRLGGLLTSSTFLSQPNPTPTKGALTERCVPPWCEPCLQPNLPSRCEFTPAQLSSSRLASSQKSVILQHSSSKLLVYYYVYYICTRLCEYFVLSSHHERAATLLLRLFGCHHYCYYTTFAAVALVPPFPGVMLFAVASGIRNDV